MLPLTTNRPSDTYSLTSRGVVFVKCYLLLNPKTLQVLHLSSWGYCISVVGGNSREHYVLLVGGIMSYLIGGVMSCSVGALRLVVWGRHVGGVISWGRHGRLPCNPLTGADWSPILTESIALQS